MKSNLKKIRQARGATLHDFGALFGFDRSHMHHLENDKREVSLEKAYRMANILGRKVEEIWPNDVDAE